MPEAGDEIRAAFKPIDTLIAGARKNTKGRNDAALQQLIEAVQMLRDRQLATELAVDELQAAGD